MSSTRRTFLHGFHDAATANAPFRFALLSPGPSIFCGLVFLIRYRTSARAGIPVSPDSSLARISAWLNPRFRFLEVPYQDAKVEEELLTQLAPAMTPVLGGMVQLANEVRKLFTEGRLSVTLSTRTLVRWVQIAQDFRNSPNSLEYGLQRALLMRAEPEESQAIVGLCRTVFGDAWSSATEK